MSVLSYLTIQSPSEGSYKEKGSKFLAFAYPVVSEGEIKENLDALRKKYYDARHHCYGWILGAEKNRYRAFDDGEPNHSAGDPIIGQIRSKNLTNVLIVVVRYFGGTKLGVGGLISAYKIAAEESLKNAVIIEKEVSVMMTLRYDYAHTPEAMRLVKDFELDIRQQNFNDHCQLEVDVKLRNKAGLEEKVALLNATGFSIGLKEYSE